MIHGIDFLWEMSCRFQTITTNLPVRRFVKLQWRCELGKVYGCDGFRGYTEKVHDVMLAEFLGVPDGRALRPGHVLSGHAQLFD